MKTIGKAMVALMAVGIGAGPIFAENNTDYIFNGTTTNYSGAFNLPTNSPGANNSLRILNGGSVSNTTANISPGASDISNRVFVTDPNSLWFSSSTLTVGGAGSLSSMTVSNNAVVRNADALTGQGGAGGNTVIVTAGGVWTNTGYLSHGNFSPSNSLVISAGGKVYNGGLFAIVGNAGGYGGNNALVTGSGSLWYSASQLIVSYDDPNSLLTVSSGGRVESASQIVVGNTAGGDNGLLVVTNAGQIVSSAAQLGVGSGSDGNQVLITGAGSVWSNSTAFYIGNSGSGNRLTIANASTARALNDIFGNSFVIGNGSSSSNNVLLVDGGNLVSVSGSILVGSSGSANQLIVTNGGHANSVGTQIGANGNNNSALVTGNGSIWTNTTGLYIGNFGSGNNLTVANGGFVYAGPDGLGRAGLFGGNASGSNNTALITGNSSLWQNNGTLVVGDVAGGNQVTVASSGQVTATQITIGNGAHNNTITVTGSGSLLSSSGQTFIGQSGSSNSLVIANGGQARNTFGQIGLNAGSQGNSATITGNGSVWSNQNDLIVGNSGSGSRVSISSSGQVVAAGVTMGNVAASSNNLITVASGGRLTQISGQLIVGAVGSGNTVIVTNGGLVTSTGVQLSNVGGSRNNTAIITGTGSVWNSSTFFLVGNLDTGNSLIISDGGQLVNGNGSGLSANIGGNASGSNNTALVTGAGSVWSNDFIHVGYQGRRNTLTLANGGKMVSGSAVVGQDTTANDNVGTVTGAGSEWQITGGSYSFGVGNFGSRNTLIVTNGGLVHNAGIAFIGANTPSSNNTIIVTGGGSTWQSDSSVLVGSVAPFVGVGSRVIVTDGGTLEANGVYTGPSGTGIISNNAGIYQYTTASPTVFTGTTSSITIRDGTISYRNVTGADIYNAQVSNIVFAGNNTFQLKNSTNAAVNYTFNSVANTGDPRIYQRLALVNGGSRWQATTTMIASGGNLLVSNSANATVAGSVTLAGRADVRNSKVTFEGPVSVSGTYVSDPSTNTFASDVTITATGAIAGGAGDLFDFKKSFFIQRPTNPSAAFNLASSEVRFSNGGAHTNTITGDDFGHSATLGYPDGFTAVNFSYGRLSLGSSLDTVCFLSGDGSVSNALYINWLDLGATNLVANLHADTNINLYYFSGNPNNAYLGNATYQLTDCDGGSGGLLMPAVPEPSGLLLTAVACGLLMRRKFRRA